MDKVIKIVISGYYGFNNSGDEAILTSILHALKEQGEIHGIQFDPIVLSQNPKSTEEMYKVKTCNRNRLINICKTIFHSDGLISGGGSLLQDITSKKSIIYYLAIILISYILRKPVFIYAQGIGPIQTRIYVFLVRKILSRSKYVSVRDEESKKFLLEKESTNKQIQVVADPVMGLPYFNILGKEIKEPLSDFKKKIGVSVRFWNHNRSELHLVANAIEKIARNQNVEFVFLPFHKPTDIEASQYVIDLLNNSVKTLTSIADINDDPIEMVKVVSQCELIIGMRLHSLIFAASQHVPIVGISYDPKIDQFLNRINVKASATTSIFDMEIFTNDIIDIVYDRDHWLKSRMELIQQLRDSAKLPAEFIARYFTELYESKR